ncbi:hypothetical protein [Mycobacteroides abscessus]|uniref:hypothetical protein n=1 Tax=Mycobacteroides abscessus TaxID=36809 RepID=UPI0013F68549|nr:hypothetical protein [Mycobacteroides abscessus]
MSPSSCPGFITHLSGAALRLARQTLVAGEAAVLPRYQFDDIGMQALATATSH